jgi:hypothetical protein
MILFVLLLKPFVVLLFMMSCVAKPEIIKITGRVEYINPGSIDEPYIIVNGIECSFKSFNKEFKYGDTLTIEGEKRGGWIRICRIVAN